MSLLVDRHHHHIGTVDHATHSFKILDISIDTYLHRSASHISDTSDQNDRIIYASISIARSKLKEYKLEDTKLIVLQGMNNEAVDVSSIRAMVMEDFYKNSEQRLQEQKVKITQLETTLQQYKSYDEMSRTLVPELKVLYPSITTLSIAHSLEVRVDSMKTDTVTLAVMKFAKHPTNTEKEKISEWLKARVGAKKLRLITE